MAKVYLLLPIWQLYCDGTASPNPGRIGLGALLIAPDGEQHRMSHAPGRQGCNNEAETLAVIMALRQAHQLGARSVKLFSDNSVVIEQLRSPRASVARLMPLFAEARQCLAVFDDTAVQWIPHHRNQEADALSRAALNLPVRRVKQKHRRDG